MSEEVKTENKNMELWNVLNQPIPAEFTTRFTKGTFTGTDIKSQYRIQKLTETFGLCGQGWGLKHIERWKDDWPGVNFGCCYVMASLWYKIGDQTFETSPQVGGTLVDGSPDECWKSAFTDVLGKCASMIGLGSDIYLGLADGKYSKPATASQAKSSAVTAPVSRPVTAADGKKNSEVPF